MRNLRNQRGITFISLVLMLVVAGFFAMLLMKLGPIYLENYTIKTVLKNLENTSGLGSRPSRDILSTLSDRLYVNEVRRLEKKNIKLSKKGGRVTLTINYEVRKPILANVDALVTFSDMVQLKTR